jgi:hypothetical protein
MQGARTYFLAGSGLARDQHGRVRAGKTRQPPDRADERRVPAGQLGHADVFEQAIGRAAMAFGRTGEQPGDAMTELEGPDRRAQKVVRDSRGQIHQILIPLRHDGDDGCAERVPLDALEELGHDRVRFGDDRDDHTEATIANVLARERIPRDVFTLEVVIAGERGMDRRVRRQNVILDDDNAVRRPLEMRHGTDRFGTVRAAF